MIARKVGRVPPRIQPGRLAAIGPVNMALSLILGRVAQMPRRHAPHVFATLGRNRRLFRAWMVFSGALMPFGRLPRQETELLILNVARNTDCAYEWQQHSRIAVAIGLSVQDVERVKAGPGATGWSDRQRALLTAADDLHREGAVGDAAWRELSRFLDEEELIEFCLLVGHYTGLAMTLNTLRVDLDPLDDEPAGSLDSGTRPDLTSPRDVSRPADRASG